MIIRNGRRTDLDLIRIIAFLIIYTFHFTVALGLQNSAFAVYRNGDWGCAGSTIFFVLSGYLLMTYDTDQLTDEKSILKFYKKKFLNIIPMQIVVFLFFYLISPYVIPIRENTYFYGGALWKIIFSFIGIDYYLEMYGVQTYSLIGEWFTAMILLAYLLFPLLYKMIRNHPVTWTFVLTFLYLGNIVFGFQRSIVADASIFTAVFMIWIGMLISYKDQNDKMNMAAKLLTIIITIVLIILIVFFKFPLLNGSNLIWKNTLGVCLFILLKLIFNKVNFSEKIKKVFSLLSKNGFAFYLCHHVMIYIYVSYLPQMLLSFKRRVFSWFILMCLIEAVSWFFTVLVKRLKFILSKEIIRIRNKKVLN